LLEKPIGEIISHPWQPGCLSAEVMNRAKVNHFRRFVFLATGFGVTNPRAVFPYSGNLSGAVEII